MATSSIVPWSQPPDPAWIPKVADLQKFFNSKNDSKNGSSKNVSKNKENTTRQHPGPRGITNDDNARCYAIQGLNVLMLSKAVRKMLIDVDSHGLSEPLRLLREFAIGEERGREAVAFFNPRDYGRRVCL